jgi:hypothetical protein
MWTFYGVCDFLPIFSSIGLNAFLEWAFMSQWIFIAVLSVVEALRRFWQKITGRVPVPVRVRRWADTGPSRGGDPVPFFSRLPLKEQPIVPQWRSRR